MSTTINSPIPSASCLLLRNAANGVETLMLARNQKLSFAAGAWVFPGGKIEASDSEMQAPAVVSARANALEVELETAKRAAIREAREETNLVIDPKALLPLSHWTTPDLGSKRFATWFFVGTVTADAEVQVDGSEIVEHRWLSVADVFAAHRKGAIQLRPPTFVNLLAMADIAHTDEIGPRFNSIELERFAPRLAECKDGIAALYHGDAGYNATDPAAEGKRHRLEMVGNDWRYWRD